jgi:small subunit ribosomal protein S3Ae
MAAQKGAEKWKMKQWFDVYAPKAISTDVIGSIPAEDEKNVTGRIMKVSLSWITHNPNHAFAIVGLKITNASGNVANTEIDYLSQQYSYLHSLVKRRADAIYTYDVVKDKEGGAVTLKLLITTRIKVAQRTKGVIRKAVHAFVTEYLGRMNKDEFLKALVANDLQSEAMKKLGAMAPIAKVEIKKVEF